MELAYLILGLCSLISAFIFIRKISRLFFYFLVFLGFITITAYVLTTLPLDFGSIFLFAIYVGGAIILLAVCLLLYEFIHGRKLDMRHETKYNFSAVQVYSGVVAFIFGYRLIIATSTEIWSLGFYFGIVCLSFFTFFLAYKRSSAFRYVVILQGLLILLALIFG